MTISKICIRYFLYLIVAMLISISLAVILKLINIELPSSTSSFIAVFVPTYWAAHTWARTNESVPEKSIIWKLAFYFTLIQISFGMLLALLLSFVDPSVSALFSGAGLAILIGSFLFIGLLILLLTRWIFPIFIRQFLKMSNR